MGIHRLCMGGRGPQWWWLGNTGFLTPVDDIYKYNPQCPVFALRLVASECRPKFLSLVLCCFQSSRQSLIVSISYCCFCGLIAQFLQSFCSLAPIFAFRGRPVKSGKIRGRGTMAKSDDGIKKNGRQVAQKRGCKHLARYYR